MMVKIVTKLNISVFLIWLIHISGIIGVLLGYKQWFLEKTSMNLLVMSILMLINIESESKFAYLAFIFVFLIGFVAEFLGVNYGYIFGNYVYGDNLGLKIGGVPLTIGLNWAVLTFITHEIASKVLERKTILTVILGSFLMLGLDVIIEPSTAKLDFWYWENNQIPLSNYLGWFLVALLPQFLYYKLNIKTNLNFSLHAFVVQIVFFMMMLIL